GNHSLGDEIAYAIAAAPTNPATVVVVGQTTSSDFPTTPGALRTTLGYWQDAFVSKITTTGGVASVVWSTYLGGNSYDYGYATTIDVAGYPYIVGNTSSSDFPLLNAWDSTQGGYEGFVTCL